MNKITLKQFCTKLGYGPNIKNKTLGDFAELVGVSISLISKVYNGKYTSIYGKSWYKLEAFVTKHGYELVNDNKEALARTMVGKENIKLRKELEEVLKKNELLKTQLEDLKNLVRICTNIAERKEFYGRRKRHA